MASWSGRSTPVAACCSFLDDARGRLAGDAVDDADLVDDAPRASKRTRWQCGIPRLRMVMRAQMTPDFEKVSVWGDLVFDIVRISFKSWGGHLRPNCLLSAKTVHEPQTAGRKKVKYFTPVRWFERYANSMFGSLLILNLFVFTSFHSLADPVQPAASTMQQVMDAIDAMEAGVTYSEAFGEQPIPYRDWGRDQKLIYETLFNLSYSIQNAVYVLDEDVSIWEEFAEVSGHTPLGDEFFIELSALVEYDFVNDSNLPSGEAETLLAVNASIIGVIGTIRSVNASIAVRGIVLQATRADGGRNRLLLPVGIADPAIVADLQGLGDVVIPRGDEDEPSEPEVDCQAAFDAANRKFLRDWEDAVADKKTCEKIAIAGWGAAMVGCAGVGVVAGVLASPTGPGAVFTGLITGTGCALGVTAALNAAGVICVIQFRAAMDQARRDRDRAFEDARIMFGAANCPANPV